MRGVRRSGEETGSKYDQPVYYSRAKRSITQPSDEERDTGYVQEKPIQRRLAPLAMQKHSIETHLHSI